LLFTEYIVIRAMSTKINELQIIENLRSIAGRDSLGLLDDCAVFGEYVITKDVLVAGVHFFPDDAPYNLARKALRVNLSDLAAMGAEPFGVLIGACLPKDISAEWLNDFNRGLKADIEEFGVQLLGGDTVFHDGALMLSVTAIGKTSKPLLRSGAKIGDNIFVSGALGGGYLGLQNKLKGRGDLRYELPNPRIELGIKLREIANSCMDISDGLLLDLNRLCEASKVGAELVSAQIPLADMAADLLEQISGGDDYELLFTADCDAVAGCYKIGKIISGQGLKLDGKLVAPKGYVHN